MNKCIRLISVLLCLSTSSWAQESIDTLELDNSDFTFTESQLDDDNDAAQTVSSITSSVNDAYFGEVGYRFSPMRFKVRAYDNMYENTYINGLMMNDLELGRFQYSMIGGLNDATRNKEGVQAFDYGNFGVTPIGGMNNINTRASAFAEGKKVTVSATNRNYKLRGMFTYATGMMDNGWAFAGSIGYRWSDEGVIEGTFYNSFSYLLSAEKRFNNQHSLSLVTFGSPTERAQQGASTEEAYWLANSHYYNPYWGYQNGKKRNSRVVHDYSPTTIATWDWKLDENRKLTTSAGVKYSAYSSSALGWNGDAYDPRPDYYKNLPSSVFDVYDLDKNNSEFLQEHPYFLEQYNSLYDYWTSSKANRQINWDRMYYVNSMQNQNGGEALYYQERRHNDQLVFALNSTWNHTLNERDKYSLGLQLNHTVGMHYKTMDDLLGGELYIDYDKFSANDYGKGTVANPTAAANDLRNPYKRIYEGDKFGYNYNILVNKAKAWGQFRTDQINWSAIAAAYTEGTTIERDGKMQNGRAPENSYGSSGTAKFLGGGAKAAFSYRPFTNNMFTLGLSYDAQAPLARNSFVAPRMQNNFVDNLTLEKIFSAEVSWKFRFGDLTGRIGGFYTTFEDQVEQTAFYNDQESRFTYLTMTGINKRHYGLEGALVYQVNGNLSFNVLGTLSDARYTNDPLAQVNYEGMDATTNAELNEWTNPVTGEQMPLRVIANGVKVGSTPLVAASIGANYNVGGWFFEMNLNYYNCVYVGYSAYRRLGNVLSSYVSTGRNDDGSWGFAQENINQTLAEDGGVVYDPEGNILKTFSPRQEKYNAGFMLDASIGKYIRLNNGKSISVNLSLQNITNNTNLRTGGFEQNRDDLYSTGVARTYKFSKNSKYYYANAFNAFLNVNYKF